MKFYPPKIAKATVLTSTLMLAPLYATGAELANIVEDFAYETIGFTQDDHYFIDYLPDGNGMLFFLGDGTNSVWPNAWNGGDNPGGWNPSPEHSNYFDNVSVSVDAAWIAGQRTDSFGIEVCLNQNRFGDSDFIRFLITTNGFYSIDGVQDGSYKMIVDWTESPAVLVDDFNNLSIAKVDGELRFSVNFQEVERWYVEGCRGGSVAIVSGNTINTAFDNFWIQELPATTTPDPTQQVEQVPDTTTDSTTEIPPDSTTTDTCDEPYLAFSGLKNFYDVGEFITVDLTEDLQNCNRFNRVDLWVAIQIPSGDLFFKTRFPLIPFDTKPQAFKTSLDNSVATHRVLEFEVPVGMGGDYNFYAVYMQEGKNPMTDGFIYQRSNLARSQTTLANQ